MTIVFCRTRGPFLVHAILVLLCFGCGHDGRVSIEGTVTLDGRPLDKGSIELRPASGTPGPSAGGDIVNGKFAIAAARGPMAGKFVAAIKAAGLTGRKVLDPRTNTMVDEYGQCLPARYNSESQLEAVVSTSGPNHFDFPLTSDKVARSPR